MNNLQNNQSEVKKKKEELFRHFTKEDKPMAMEHTREYHSLEMHIKTTMRYHYMLIKIAKIQS